MDSFTFNFRARKFSWLDLTKLSVMVVLWLIVLEIFLCRFAPTTSTPNMDPQRYPYPFTMFHYKKNHFDPKDVLGKTNSQGWRYSEIGKKTKPRVFLLGNSVLDTGYLAGDIRPHTQIRKYFLDRGSDIEFIPVSIVSGVTAQSLASLVYDIADASPDMVVALEGFNDLYQIFSAESRPGYPIAFQWYENALLKRGSLGGEFFDKFSWGDLFLLKSHFLSLFPERKSRERIIESATYENAKASHTDGAPVERSKSTAMEPYCLEAVKNWKKMAQFARGSGFEMLFALQPFRGNLAEESRGYDCIRSAIRSDPQLRDRFIDFAAMKPILDSEYLDDIHPLDNAVEKYSMPLAEKIFHHRLLEPIKSAALKSRNGKS